MVRDSMFLISIFYTFTANTERTYWSTGYCIRIPQSMCIPNSSLCLNIPNVEHKYKTNNGPKLFVHQYTCVGSQKTCESCATTTPPSAPPLPPTSVLPSHSFDPRFKAACHGVDNSHWR